MFASSSLASEPCMILMQFCHIHRRHCHSTWLDFVDQFSGRVHFCSHGQMIFYVDGCYGTAHERQLSSMSGGKMESMVCRLGYGEGQDHPAIQRSHKV